MAESILVVDDDESLLDLCSTALKMEGYHVTPVESGDRAVKRLESQTFDLVLTDLVMPGKVDGHGVVKAVKSRRIETDVIVMTATPTLRSAIATLKDGACDYVIKPFETDHLKTVVRRALDHRRMRQELTSEKSLRRELQSAYEELQKVEQLKESFLARISHELRTPLSELLTAMELLEQSAFSDPKRLEKYLSLSKAGAGRLDRTLADLLAFVDLQRKPTLQAPDAVDLGALCREAAEALKPAWEKRSLRMALELPADLPRVQGDSELLRRAFEHLIHNAVLFNREKGSVTVRGGVVRGSVEISVADTGEGIPESEFDNIFDSFYQIANYLTRKVEGLGLGLAITRRIIEAHAGSVTVSSKLGEGTVFVVRLPFAGPAKA